MYFKKLALAALLAATATGAASAADMPVKAVKAVSPAPFFFVNDNSISYHYEFLATNPGAGKTPKHVLSFTHFDVWAYGTNFFNVDWLKATSLQTPTAGGGAPYTEIYGFFRSTFGFNEIFNTKAFSVGPLHNVSLEVGMDANTENRYFGAAKRDVVAGLQFAFDLPYKGYFNVAPLVYWEFWNHDSFSQCGAGWTINNTPGVGCNADGNMSYKPTWAIETNYYMDLGFLPENMQFFSVSGRLAWYGPKGSDTSPLPNNPANNVFPTKVEFNSEPIRLTLDASKALWGPKYSHFVDVWVAYRYWQNKFGEDHNAPSVACSATIGGVNRPSGACTESSLYSGITVKF
jgi:hypothetical protein